jgi:hypothetical protein
VRADERHELGHDFRRSLTHRDVYRKSFEQYWSRAIADGVKAEPCRQCSAAPAAGTVVRCSLRIRSSGTDVSRPSEASMRQIRGVKLRGFLPHY